MPDRAVPPERIAEDVEQASAALAALYARMGWARHRPPLAEAATPEALGEYARRRRRIVAEQLAAEPEPVSTTCDLGEHALCPGCGCGCHPR